MDSVKIIIFDEEELTQTLVENYLKELIFPFTYEKYSEFDSDLINNSEENQIVILNINKCNLDYINEVSELSKRRNICFVIISYDGSTDIQVKALKAGAKDFLLKPLIKTDFVYSMQQVYKYLMYKNKVKDTTKVFSVLSSFENDGKTTFAVNIAHEISSISKEKVIIIDVINSSKTVAGKINTYNQGQGTVPFLTEIMDDDEIFPRYKDSELYVLSCNMGHNIQENILKANIKILKKNYKYIIFCIHNTDDNMYKKAIADNSDEVFYIISDNTGNIEKLKSDIKYINQAKNNIVLNQTGLNDKKRINHIQVTIGQEALYKIPKNYMAAEKAEINRITLNEAGLSYDISQKYKEIAETIINKV
jgi:FixJ family two-component response regulator